MFMIVHRDQDRKSASVNVHEDQHPLDSSIGLVTSIASSDQRSVASRTRDEILCKVKKANKRSKTQRDPSASTTTSPPRRQDASRLYISYSTWVVAVRRSSLHIASLSSQANDASCRPQI